MVLAIMPLGLLFFGGGGALVIADDYGFGDRAVQAGIAVGLGVNVLLCVIAVTRRPLTAGELRRSRAAYHRVTGGGPVVAFAAIGMVLAIVVTRSELEPFFISLCFALMTGASVLAGFLAISRRGLHQRDDATEGELVVWTHTQTGRPGEATASGSNAGRREPPRTDAPAARRRRYDRDP